MIPVNEPNLSGNELKYLQECIETGWVSSDGPFIKKFEQCFADYIGSRYGIAVSSGTAALETALYAAGVEPGDEVILPSFTIISCAIAILRLGATPVLVDIEPETWNMDTQQVKAKITDKTKVIMPVHIYGHPVDMDPLLELAQQHQIFILEDAAEVHGAEYKGRKCGAMGDLSAFSFYANKLVTTGEGGMVLTNNEAFAQRAQSYRNLCFKPEARFLHDEIGYNFRMTNLQAAIGVAQVEKLEETVRFKRQMGKLYRERLEQVEGIRFQIEKEWAKSVYWMYSVILDEQLGITAQQAMEQLKKQHIGTRPFFKGLHAQPVLLEKGYFQREQYPNTDFAYQYGFYLPSGMTLDESKIDQVCHALQKILESLR